MGTMTTLAARMAALADELEADAPHSTSENGLMQAADAIRAELAADGPQSVWAVRGDEYEDNGVRAILATPELAEQHRAQLAKYEGHSDYDIEEFDVLDRLPQRVQYVAMKAIVHPSGMVEVVPSNAGKRQAVWGYEASGSFHCYRAPDGRTHVDVCDVDPEPLLREKVAEVITGFAAEQGWSESKLEWALGREWVSRRPEVVEQRCYEASFGWVHVRSTCTCPR